eukprot:2776830-Amphidinium_carterae.1
MHPAAAFAFYAKAILQPSQKRPSTKRHRGTYRAEVPWNCKGVSFYSNLPKDCERARHREGNALPILHLEFDGRTKFESWTVLLGRYDTICTSWGRLLHFDIESSSITAHGRECLTELCPSQNRICNFIAYSFQEPVQVLRQLDNKCVDIYRLSLGVLEGYAGLRTLQSCFKHSGNAKDGDVSESIMALRQRALSVGSALEEGQRSVLSWKAIRSPSNAEELDLVQEARTGLLSDAGPRMLTYLETFAE